MAKFEFGFEESWFRLCLKLLPLYAELFSTREENVEKAQNLLRIGKTKVGAARVWAESAGLIKRQKGGHGLSAFGKILAEYDPDLEEDGAWWAIHYNLSRADSPSWFYAFYVNLFNHETFQRSDLEAELRAHWDQNNEKPMTDSVFEKLIYPPLKQVFDGTRLGEEFGLFFQNNEDKEYERRPVLAKLANPAIFAYSLCRWARTQKRQTAHINALLEPYSPGKIFFLDRETLDEMLLEIGSIYEKQVSWISHTANLNSITLMDLDPNIMILAYYRQLDGLSPLDAFKQAVQEVKGY